MALLLGWEPVWLVLGQGKEGAQLSLPDTPGHLLSPLRKLV